MTDLQVTGYAALFQKPLMAFYSDEKPHTTVRRLLYEDTSPALLLGRR